MMSKGKTASLPIDFIVVGAGTAGLAAAFGLSRAGHRVTVLEEYGDSKDTAGGVRSPPNMTKIIRGRWGLEEEFEKIAFESENISILNYETGELCGSHRWNEDLMRQAGGMYNFMHLSDLANMLADNARFHGAQIRYNEKVVSMTKGSLKANIKPSVTLASGETLTADVIVGADGPDSTVKHFLLGERPVGKPMGLLMWNTLLPWSALEADPDLTYFSEQKDNFCTFYGDFHSVVTFPVRGPSGDNFAVHVFTPDDGTLQDPGRGSWRKQVPTSMLVNAMHKCDPRLVRLVELGRLPTCVRMFETPPSEDWGTPDTPVILISDAAHALFPGAIQHQSMAIEDAACLSEIFTHLKGHDQIATFLDAFEEVRRPRIEAIRESENYTMRFMTMPPGPLRDVRDENMRVAREAGKGVFDGEDAYEAVLEVFAYDAIDEATDWWMKWGILKERHIGRHDEPLDITIQRTVYE
ncbi:FAD/NAD(P)-binding domain-containing protein [Neolentinus lepideus HHB14362 ss-1]|uniref:FAD/NAD(P)-binding domain-containing protein n=1 Tax=Neolentinus lepideus HHB14362 ss-1 TaxID=1314782 RepID=A0A165RTV4_9AGAM|nr:FAD/NAD(P)-binding domain-containing protein [Neolentinus lepideus HHB14362 ss-1]